MIKNKYNIFFKILIVIISFIGILFHFIEFRDLKILLYYTLLSNLFVLIFYAVTIIIDIKKNDKYHLTKGLMLLSITCTMMIYYFTLSSNENIYVGHTFLCSLVHIIVPLLVILDCLFFEDKRKLKYKYVFYWIIPLFMYFIFILIFASLGGTFFNGQGYPYDFLNVSKYGLMGCTIKCIAILIFYILLSLGIIYIDKKLIK